MKKLFSSFIVCLIGTMSLFAQTNPNRVIITEKSGNYKSFLAERIDSIWFAKLEGRIAAEIEYLGYVEGGGENGEDIIQIAVTRTGRICSEPKPTLQVIWNQRTARCIGKTSLRPT